MHNENFLVVVKTLYVETYIQCTYNTFAVSPDMFLSIIMCFLVFRLGEEVGGLFMQASPHSRICTNLAGARDSGYDSFHRQLCILDRVVYTHPVWLLLSLSYKEATRILQNQPTGVRNLTSYNCIGYTAKLISLLQYMADFFFF